MGTRNNPGGYDCHSKAHPDEPTFTLLARDPLAHHLVAIWAALAGGKASFAQVFLQDAIAQLATTDPQPEAKWKEALACAEQMKRWLEATPGAGRTALSADSPTPKSESTDTPSAAGAAA